MALNKTIRKLRKRAGLTQVQLAERAGVGLRFTKELERGKPTVRMDKVNQVLEFFGYQADAVRDRPVAEEPVFPGDHENDMDQLIDQFPGQSPDQSLDSMKVMSDSE